MKPIVRIEGKSGSIVLVGQFDFNVHKDFRAASQELLENSAISHIEVDFEQVPYLDSSALGMLLLLKERAGAAGKDLALVNCRDTVRQVLEIACFTKLFTIR
ncbi:STAS domain-containing protein [Vogesella oryzae]|uniref:STAS domain-containing protein n=1 Tax=Vogesella oryzae TaxID=1735285 RepID=UPI00158348A6|nr:STAS domain-containing protein [Vogesella oryzae]